MNYLNIAEENLFTYKRLRLGENNAKEDVMTKRKFNFLELLGALICLLGIFLDARYDFIIGKIFIIGGFLFSFIFYFKRKGG